MQFYPASLANSMDLQLILLLLLFLIKTLRMKIKIFTFGLKYFLKLDKMHLIFLKFGLMPIKSKDFSKLINLIPKSNCTFNHYSLSLSLSHTQTL